MKKAHFILLLCSALALTGCSNTYNDVSADNPTSSVVATTTATQSSTTIKNNTTKEETTTQKANDNSWISILSKYVESSYDNVKSGQHKKEYVILPCTIASTEYSKTGNCVTCDAWFTHGDSYVSQSITFYLDELKDYSPKDIHSGDNLKICFYINSDGSFGSTIKGFVYTKDDISLDDIYTTYKANCSLIEYENLLRYPDDLKGTTYSFDGKVFQIISEENNYVEMLILYNDSNLIHVKYFYKDGEPKMIEGDEITVYGTFYYLFSYLTVAGTKKTIPSITAEFVDNHNVEQSNTSLKDVVESKANEEVSNSKLITDGGLYDEITSIYNDVQLIDMNDFLSIQVNVEHDTIENDSIALFYIIDEIIENVSIEDYFPAVTFTLSVDSKLVAMLNLLSYTSPTSFTSGLTVLSDDYKESLNNLYNSGFSSSDISLNFAKELEELKEKYNLQ